MTMRRVLRWHPYGRRCLVTERPRETQTWSLSPQLQNLHHRPSLAQPPHHPHLLLLVLLCHELLALHESEEHVSFTESWTSNEEELAALSDEERGITAERCDALLAEGRISELRVLLQGYGEHRAAGDEVLKVYTSQMYYCTIVTIHCSRMVLKLRCSTAVHDAEFEPIPCPFRVNFHMAPDVTS